jgi:hypothetical protein
MTWPLVSVRPQVPVYALSTCVRFVLERCNDHERVLDRDIPGSVGSTPLGFALPILHRLSPVRGYNPLDIRRYKEYVQFISDDDKAIEPAGGIGDFPIINKPLLDLIGVRFLLQPSDFQTLEGEREPVGRDRRWRQVSVCPKPEAYLFIAGGIQRLPSYTVYENREAFPRAFVVPSAEPLPSRGRVRESIKAADLRRVVFLEGFQPQPETVKSHAGFQRAAIVTYQPNHVELEVNLTAPGYLVLTDPWYPGWTCKVDGLPHPIYRADFAFRAVRVGTGQHRVHFRFDPPSFRRGKMISMAGLVGVLGLCMIKLGRVIPSGHRRPGIV